MTGSSLAPIVIPIVMLPVLAIWLTIVYYAANHPQNKRPGSARQRPPAASGPAEVSPVPRQGGPAAPPAGPPAQPREESAVGGARR
jgi:hypothetical protein